MGMGAIGGEATGRRGARFERLSPRRAVGIALLMLCAPLLPACGYSGEGVYRKDIQTIYVDMFTSREFRRNLEFQLTEAVKKRVNLETPYRLAEKSEADTILRGEILEERQAAFAPDFASRLPREIQLTLACRLEWKDARTGKILIDRPVLLQAADYLRPTGETERYTQQVVIDKLAERIVEQMYDAW